MHPLPINKQQVKTDRNTGKKVRITVLSTILFAVLSHMVAFRIAESINVHATGEEFSIITEEGVPTLKGTALMTIIFFAVMLYLMFF
jgi:hypothetical protein